MLSPQQQSSFRYLNQLRTTKDRRAEDLYLAATRRDWAVAEKLLHEGAPCNYQSAWGRTALHSALYENHVKDAPPTFFEELVEKSKSVINLGTDSGNTPLHWACKFASAGEVNILLRHGADPNIKNKAGQTALDVAKEKDDKNLADILKAAGAKSS